MTIKVLVVDDSSFFRRRVSEIVNQDPELEVIGMANNGAEAVKLAAELKPQVITMDIEMPVMDGITAVRQIMASHPTPILMFSSLTHDGAKRPWMRWTPGLSIFCPNVLRTLLPTRTKRFDCFSKESRRWDAGVYSAL